MEKLINPINSIIEQMEGDMLTPISIFQKISGRKKFLLESSLKHENTGRYSIIGADPILEVKGYGNQNHLITEKGEELVNGRTLDIVKELIPNYGEQEGNFPFAGGAVGYVGYDTIRQYENIGATPEKDLEMPDVHLMFYEQVIIYDHLEQKVYLAASPILEDTTKGKLVSHNEKRRKELLAEFHSEEPKEVGLSSFKSTTTKEKFIENVEKAKEYISSGDIFQVVLSQRMHASFEGDPFSFYRKLRISNPSPYMYYLDFEDYVVAGSSPESLVKAKQSVITTNPIAGTRPRGNTAAEDDLLAKGLIQDEKELAEHRMLVDLGRNDLGKICKFGSVNVHKYMALEKFKHVMHIVSEVSGELSKNHKAADALISCLPAGTVSGAPKIRAMEIINELETEKRGVYSGAIGYFSVNGNMDFALAIRTMVIKDNTAYIQAGAGIVYDSVPEKEYEETIHKLKTFLEDPNDFIN
ncbi:anthranilate synthase component I [Bacillus marasmi]|uniref:anthranilate synthase component I n=1 Tax=Bacillus marasmi TaxID=1926279 RepID=UPI0011C97F27|nr:anthranilate synthase component I [Bacillus marasmi]